MSFRASRRFRSGAKALAGMTVVAGLACSSDAPTSLTPLTPLTPEAEGKRYLRDADHRRAEMIASLVAPDDGYARARSERYGKAWESLPVWNPRTTPITPADFEGADDVPFLPDNAAKLAVEAAAGGDEAALLELGRAAFSRYPAQLLPTSATALSSADAAARYGFPIDPVTSQVGGLVRAEMADGHGRVAMTCATCHSRPRAGRIVPGVPNAELDLGLLAVEAGAVSPERSARTLAWGPGRVDVSSLDASEPARIPDLRPVRWLSHLQQDGTVAQRSITSLALRIETLILTAHDEVLRPPREIALALSVLLWSFADGLPSVEAHDEAGRRGRQVMQRSCAGCHGGEGLTGPPAVLSLVGTDTRLGLSPERGTGHYRVPSLRGVASRGPLLHDASAPSLAVFLDPARREASFTGGRDGGAVPGHTYDDALSAEDRAALLAYLRGL